MMNTIAVAFYAFWSICFYNTTQSPDWIEGSIAMIVSGSCMMVGVFVVRFLENREKRVNVIESVEEGSDAQSYDVTDEKNAAAEAGTIITPAKTAAGIV